MLHEGMKFFISFIRKTIICFYQSYLNMSEHDGFEHAGYLAFLLILSICPFFIILINFGGKLAIFFMQSERIVADYLNIIIESIPDNIINFLKPRIREIVNGPSDKLLQFSFLSAIWTASSIIEGMRTILNRANEFNCSSNYLYRRLMSIVRFFSIIVLIVFSIICIKIFPVLLHYIHEENNSFLWQNIFHYLQMILNFLLIFFCTSFFYIIIPNVQIGFKRALPGTFFLFCFAILMTKIFTFYVTNFYSQINFTYGSLAGIIIVMLFFYLLSLGFIFGAELNQNYFEYQKKK